MKRFFILFLLMFTLPLAVKAEEDYVQIEDVTLSTTKYDRANWNISYMCRDARCHYYYATSYEYDNGQYHLTGTTKVDNFDSLIRFDHWGDDIFYTCKSNESTSCDSLYAVFVNERTIINQEATAIKLENGQDVEDVRYIKIANDYEKVDGKYVLTDPEVFDLSTILRNHAYLENKYYCNMMDTECDSLNYFFMASAGASDFTTTEHEYVYATDYYYEDGVFKLKDIVDVKWPKYEEKEGYYTCLSKGTACKKLYKAGTYTPSSYAFNYEFIEFIDSDKWEFQKITYKEYSVSANVGEDILGATYFPEGAKFEVEDPDILKIEDGKITFLKPGETRIIAKHENSCIVLSVIVNENDIVNPKTGTGVLILIILVLSIVAFGTFMILATKIKSYIS